MKRIDRREYLKRMASAGAGFSLVQFDPLKATEGLAQRAFGSIASGGLSSLLVPEVCPTSWPCTGRLPDNPTVRLIFAGMVGFTYKITGKDTEGRAVFHRGDDGHKLKVIVHKGSSPNCTEIYRNEAIPKKTTFDIRVRDRSDANFFMSTTPFKREDLQGDDKDFRWLLDLEAPPFAPGKQPRNERKFSTKLNVGNGTFYTYKHAGSTFHYIDKTSKPKNLGYVPKVMAADIPVENGECLSFKIGSKDVLKNPICNGDKYEIFFLNEYELPCDDRNNKKCFDSDFKMSFDAFDSYAPFDLLLDEPSHDNGPTDDLCIKLPTPHHRLNDEAPCMGSGYGGGGGFP